MKKTYKNAFTLAELLIVMVVIGILVVLLLPGLNMDNLNEKANRAKATKILRIFNEASIKLKAQSDICPTGNFIEKFPGNNGQYKYEYTIYKNADSADKTKADGQDLISAYSNHIKFDKRLSIDVQGSDTNYESPGQTIAGAKIAGDNIYIGIHVYGEPKKCPDFFNPEIGEQVTIVEDNNIAPQCWGELYIDVNGEKAPNEFSKDAYIFGLDKDGINLQSQRFN